MKHPGHSTHSWRPRRDTQQASPKLRLEAMRTRMLPPKVMTFGLLVMPLLFVACAEPQLPGPEYLTEEIPPCAPIEGFSEDPCKPASWVGGNYFDLSHPGAAHARRPLRSIRSLLDDGITIYSYYGNLLGNESHIVLRGVPLLDTLRCAAGDRRRVPAFTEGILSESELIRCFADVQVRGYILGTGPPRLTVQLEALEYDVGSLEQDYVGKVPNITTVQQAEELLRTNREQRFMEYFTAAWKPGENMDLPDRRYVLFGRESILAIGPSNDAGTEVWQLYRLWGLERREDGRIFAVHPLRWAYIEAGSDLNQEYAYALEMTLPEFKRRVEAVHQDRLGEYGGRVAPEDVRGRAKGVELPLWITDANELKQFLVDTGAYNHPDGPPAQPPPP